MRDTVIDFQSSGTWKVQLTIANNLIYSEDVDEKRVMHSKSNNGEFLTYNNWCCWWTFRVTSFEIPNWFRGSDFIFDSVQLLYYKCHKTDFKRGGSNIESADWIK